MKIFNRQDFMKLPSGVIYCKGSPWVFSDMNVKGDTINIDGKNIDFATNHFNWVDGNDCGECVERLELMLHAGASFPMHDIECYGRDGCFDETDLFLVFEKADLENLVKVFQEALTVSSTIN